MLKGAQWGKLAGGQGFHNQKSIEKGPLQRKMSQLANLVKILLLTIMLI